MVVTEIGCDVVDQTGLPQYKSKNPGFVNIKFQSSWLFSALVMPSPFFFVPTNAHELF